MLLDCDQCPKKFHNKYTLKAHKKIHLAPDERQRHLCPFCDKTFIKLRSHIKKVHIGIKAFICEECGKGCKSISALKDHQVAHQEERPFACSHCPKTFKTNFHLRDHEVSHTDTNKFICPVCGVALKTRHTYKNHLLVHSDEKKFKCHYCDKRFKQSKTLKNHLIMHSGMHPYSCPFCDKTFVHGPNLRLHKVKAHPVELAALEASGVPQPVTRLPKLEQLQPRNLNTSSIQKSVVL